MTHKIITLCRQCEGSKRGSAEKHNEKENKIRGGEDALK